MTTSWNLCGGGLGSLGTESEKRAVKTAHISCESARVLKKGRRTFVLPALSCKLVTPELICEKSDLAFGRG